MSLLRKASSAAADILMHCFHDMEAKGSELVKVLGPEAALHMRRKFAWMSTKVRRVKGGRIGGGRRLGVEHHHHHEAGRVHMRDAFHHHFIPLTPATLPHHSLCRVGSRASTRTMSPRC